MLIMRFVFVYFPYVSFNTSLAFVDVIYFDIVQFNESQKKTAISIFAVGIHSVMML